MLAARGIAAPFQIQTRVIPEALAGSDVLAKSPTGSGKTLAFAIPIVERSTPATARPAALVLVPTRELAVQVTEVLADLGKARGLEVASVYGGVAAARAGREGQEGARRSSRRRAGCRT